MSEPNKRPTPASPETISKAVEREIERLKKIDPGSDTPETRIRLRREIEGMDHSGHRQVS